MKFTRLTKLFMLPALVVLLNACGSGGSADLFKEVETLKMKNGGKASTAVNQNSILGYYEDAEGDLLFRPSF